MKACICSHNIGQHDQIPPHDAVACTLCDCPDFCTEEEADEINHMIYEWALENGEVWAGTAHEYRRRRLGKTHEG